MTRVNQGGLPGIDARLAGYDNQVWWGEWSRQTWVQGYIYSGTTDAGNTPTTQLRAGLVLGRITSSGKLTAYNKTNTDGSEIAVGVMEMGIGMLDAGGNAQDKLTNVLVGGLLKSGALIGLDSVARKQMQPRFIFDDDLTDNEIYLGPPLREKNVVNAASPYAVPTSENGTLYQTLGATGAVQFVLPPVQAGLNYDFLNLAAQNLEVSINAADTTTMKGYNNAGFTNVTLEGSGTQIGAGVKVYANQAGTFWYVKASNLVAASSGVVVLS